MPIYALNEHVPQLPANNRYWIAPSADVMGKVRLEEDASIWFSAVLRGDNELIHIGARSNVQDGAVIHTDIGYPATIGADCTIGHKAIIHGAIIGEGTLIGMGAVVLNGVKIGKNCLVGAGALITEGKEFPDGSLIVGSPAQLKRSLDDEWIKKLYASAASYAQNARRFAEELKAL